MPPPPFLGNELLRGDLVYFARPASDPAHAIEIDPDLASRDRVGWYAAEELEELGANAEIRAWVRRALDEVPTTC